MKTAILTFLFLILPVSITAQLNYSIHNKKILLTPFSARTINPSTQEFKQELNQIINKSKSTKSVNEYYLIDSLIAESVSGGKIKFLFEYNTKGKMIERTEFLKDTNSNWQMTDKDEYLYDTNNNLVREIYLSWNNVTWDSVIQNLYEYNQDNNLISTTIQWYVIGNWENSSRTTYTYDQAGNQINSLSELWENNGWTNYFMLYNYYSPENRRDSLLSQNWDGNNWQNFSRTSFYYDTLTTFLKLISAQLWTGNQYQDFLKVKITNDELGNQIQQLGEIWDGSEWVNDVKKDYTFIGYYFESCNAELWNGTNWEPEDTPILVTNPDGFNISIISQNISIYYKIVNVGYSNSNSPKDFSLSQNYPNPFNPKTSMQFTIGSRQFVSLKVYDILGREITTLVNEEKPVGEYEVEFNGTNLPSGIYFYQLKASNFVESRKMVLIK